MKKTQTLNLVFLMVMTVLGFPLLQAQDDDGLHFGVRAGVIIAKQTFDEGNLDEDPESKFGLDLAAVLNLPLGGTFDLQPEVHWLQKGYKIEDAQASGDVTSTLNYLEIPILLRVNIGEGAKIFAFGGPSIGFFLGGKYEDDLVEIDLDSDDVESTEWGVHVGAGIGLGIFEVDVRYMAGLSDTAPEDSGFEGVKNTGFGAGLTLMF